MRRESLNGAVHAKEMSIKTIEQFINLSAIVVVKIKSCLMHAVRNSYRPLDYFLLPNVKKYLGAERFPSVQRW